MLSLTNSNRARLTYTDPEFEQLKPLIEELYIKQGKTLKEVSQSMEQYGLKATKYQYEKAFRQWNWNKNIPSYHWDRVCLALFRLMDSAKRLEVFHNGDKVEDDRVQREMRKRTAALSRDGGAPVVLPDGIVILARTDTTLTLFFQLPFHLFNDCIMTIEASELQQRSFIDVSTNSFDAITFTHTSLCSCSPTQDAVNATTTSLTTWQSHPGLLHTLESVTSPVLSSIQLPGRLTIGPGMQMEVTAYHWQMLFSIANNFAGLTGLDVIKFLRVSRIQIRQMVHYMIRRVSTCHTTQSLICNLMRLCIEAGDARIINLMLIHSNETFNADSLICFVDGVKCTALEKASLLRHRDAVEVLLHHKANIWTTITKRNTCGSLNALEFIVNHCTIRPQRTLDREIMSLLIEAGGRVTCRSLLYLIRTGNSGLLQSLFEARGVIDKETVFDEGVFHVAVSYLDEDLCLELLSHLNHTISDINRPIQCYYNNYGYAALTMLDIAAKKGYFDVFKGLLHKGARPSPFTLGDALDGGNEDLLSLLFKNGVNLQSMDCYGMQRLKKRWDMASGAPRMLSDYDSNYKPLDVVDPQTYLLTYSPHFCSYLANECCHDDDNRMGSCLMTAISNGRDEEARVLTMSGACLNHVVKGYSKPPLHEALMRRSKILVYLLLDAGADPNSYHGVLAIDIAACWGNHEVVQRLVDAGAYVDHGISSGPGTSALYTAVKNADKAMVKLLLRCNPHPTEPQWRSAIQTAVENDDTEMVQLLFTLGARLECGTTGPFESEPYITIYKHAYRNTRLGVDHFSIGQNGFSHAELFNTGLGLKDETKAEKQVAKEPGTGDSTIGLTDNQIRICNFEDEWCSVLKHGREKLDLTRCKLEIRHLILDAYKHQCLPCYQEQVILNLENLILSKEHDEFTRFINERFNSVSTAKNSAAFMHMYYSAVAQVKRGNLLFVKTLLEHGCSPQALIQGPRPYDPHLTAFLGAIATGRSDVVKLFIEHKADVNLTPYLRVKRTPLQQAAAYGYSDIVKLLVTHGANVNAPATRFGGATALQFAAIGGYNAIIDHLVSYGAEVDAPAAQMNGRTALEGAAEHGRLDTVKVLLNAGAAHKGEDQAQIQRAIDYADKNGHPYISDLLREHLVKDGGSSESPSGNFDHFDGVFDWSRWDENAMFTD